MYLRKMRKIGLLSLVLLGARAVSAQQTAPIDANKYVQFSETNHDFGNIEYKHPVFFVVNMKNISGQRLILSKVQSSCGCTVPEWKPGPYAADSSFQVKISFNGYQIGHFEKSIRLIFNDNIVKVISFHGEGVETKKEG